MRIKTLMLGVLSVLVLSVLAVSPAFAAGSARSRRVPVAGPEADWQPLAPGKRMWYQFNYAGDQSQIEVTLRALPADSVSFAVWTPGEMQQWQQTGVQEAVGRSSPDAALGGAANWSGSFGQAGAYYIVVANGAAVPAAYQMTITGTGVSIPAAATPAKIAAVRKVAPYVTDSEKNEEKLDLVKSEAAEPDQVSVAEIPRGSGGRHRRIRADRGRGRIARGRTRCLLRSPHPSPGAPRRVARRSAPGATPANAIPAAPNNAGDALQLHEVRWYTFQVAGKDSRTVVRLDAVPAELGIVFHLDARRSAAGPSCAWRSRRTPRRPRHAKPRVRRQPTLGRQLRQFRRVLHPHPAGRPRARQPATSCKSPSSAGRPAVPYGRPAGRPYPPSQPRSPSFHQCSRSGWSASSPFRYCCTASSISRTSVMIGWMPAAWMLSYAG